MNISKDELRRYYQKQPDDERRMYGEAGRRHKQRRRLEVLQEAMRRVGTAPLRVLDVGCGDGYAAAALLGSVPYRSYVGVDLSPAKLLAAASRLPRSTSLMADAEALPVADGTVDCVLCLETLEHLPSPERALQEILRVLAPGGVCVLSVPVDSSLQLTWMAIRRRLPIGRSHPMHEHIQVFTLGRLRRLWAHHRFQRTYERLCAFSFPFDGLIQRLPYGVYRTLDRSIGRIPIQRVGIGSKVSVAIGRDYYVAVLRKPAS